MDNMQIFWLATISSANARVAGMQAENAHCALLGETPKHGEEAFASEAAGLEHIAIAARNYP